MRRLEEKYLQFVVGAHVVLTPAKQVSFTSLIGGEQLKECSSMKNARAKRAK